MRRSIAGSDSCPPKFGFLALTLSNPPFVVVPLVSTRFHSGSFLTWPISRLIQKHNYVLNLSLHNSSVSDQWRSSSQNVALLLSLISLALPLRLITDPFPSRRFYAD